MYTFSTDYVAEFYGRKFYSITNSNGELVAYSEKVFEVPKEVTLYPGKQTLIFGNAVIWGGEIWGGEIRGGVIRGGEIWGGEIKSSLLQIQGSRHFCYVSNLNEGEPVKIGIGCKHFPISYWLENFVSIGVKEEYTLKEIEEYGEYIRLYAKKYAPELLTDQTETK